MITSYSRFVPAALLGVGVLLISGVREQYVVPPAAPLQSLKIGVGDVTANNIVVGDEERRVAGMSEYVMREYTRQDSSTAFTVYVGYYDRQVQGKTIHSPKNCLPGAGWEILKSEALPFPSPNVAGRINRVLLANKGTHALVYYWYQGRGRIESNEYRVKWDLLRDAALMGRTEEALVRIVVPLPPASKDVNEAATLDAADRLAKSVAGELGPEVYRLLPPRVQG